MPRKDAEDFSASHENYYRTGTRIFLHIVEDIAGIKMFAVIACNQIIHNYPVFSRQLFPRLLFIQP